jgi:DNA modification methylase
MRALPTVACTALRTLDQPGDMVLDPFGGTGTVGAVYKMLGWHCTMIELRPDFAAYAAERIAATPDHPPAWWKSGIPATRSNC